jgi:hypothetical protein
VFAPYTLDAERIEWFTGYHIGQRLTQSFSKYNRIFLGGWRVPSSWANEPRENVVADGGGVENIQLVTLVTPTRQRPDRA